MFYLIINFNFFFFFLQAQLQKTATVCQERIENEQIELLCLKPTEFIQLKQASAGFVVLGLKDSPICEDTPAFYLNISSTFNAYCTGRTSCPIDNDFLNKSQVLKSSTYSTRLDTTKYYQVPLKLIIVYECVSK